MEPTGPNQKILQSVEKVLALPQNIPIYYYAGHGNDICDETTHKPIIKQVPENCIYITVTECGLYSELDIFESKREGSFRSTNPIHKKIFQYPYVRDNKKKLAELIEVSDVNNIHIHFPGMDYVESFFQPAAFWDKNEEQWAEGDNYVLFTTSGLLEKSKMETNPNPGKEIASENPESFFISKNEILKKYTDSVHPTQATINEILEESFADKYILDTDDMNIFIDKVFDKMTDDTLTNTYMMEHFPGIHYNVICRSVSENCEPEAALQRTVSGQQEMRREQKNIEELISQRIVFPKQLQANIKKFKKNMYSRKRNKSKKIGTKKRKL